MNQDVISHAHLPPFVAKRGSRHISINSHQTQPSNTNFHDHITKIYPISKFRLIQIHKSNINTLITSKQKVKALKPIIKPPQK